MSTGEVTTEKSTAPLRSACTACWDESLEMRRRTAGCLSWKAFSAGSSMPCSAISLAPMVTTPPSSRRSPASSCSALLSCSKATATRA